jgi:long-chain acyl-CoA synthetase
MDYTSGIMPLTPVHKPPFTVEAPGYEKVPGETIPRRHPRAKDGLRTSPAEGVHTVWDIVQRSARTYPNHQAVGSRKLVKLHKETKKVQKNVDGQIQEVDKEWQYFELSPFTFLTYKQYEERVLQVASGLRALGLATEHKFHLFGTTRYVRCAPLAPRLPHPANSAHLFSLQWISVSHACASQSVPIVTAYDTLGAEGVAHTLVQSGADFMYVDPHLLKTATDAIRKSKVRTIIVNTDCIFAVGDEIDAFQSANPDIKVVTYNDLVKLGEENPVEPIPAKGSDLYCIMYTSGSTGVPKGACISHQALVAGGQCSISFICLNMRWID